MSDGKPKNDPVEPGESFTNQTNLPDSEQPQHTVAELKTGPGFTTISPINPEPGQRAFAVIELKDLVPRDDPAASLPPNSPEGMPSFSTGRVIVFGGQASAHAVAKDLIKHHSEHSPDNCRASIFVLNCALGWG